MVHHGETVVLLGPSGAGKTALVRALLGLEGPVSDPPLQLKVRGRPAAGSDLAALAGWVPEGDGVFLSDTVWDNVARPPFATPSAPEDAREALELVGLADRAADPVAHLGRHGRRRVALARALASRRPLLVVDGELDPALWGFLAGVIEQAPAVEAALLATATAGERARVADSVALVAGERVVAQGTLSSLAASHDPEVIAVLAWVAPSTP